MACRDPSQYDFMCLSVQAKRSHKILGASALFLSALAAIRRTTRSGSIINGRAESSRCQPLNIASNHEAVFVPFSTLALLLFTADANCWYDSRPVNKQRTSCREPPSRLNC
jgi:hypothetical protein